MDGSLGIQEAVVFGMSLDQGDQLQAGFKDQVDRSGLPDFSGGCRDQHGFSPS